ncbi:hypothetical protein QSV34_08080 [Porticoccus sp. W117]|uniref:hypothetical protein n=1 Tax=Porticoccus sp. W117 TaxID=3054777 RepID=UPI00259A814A|nr:hypothetical protein [Porticoccus sp. W117]MDM3871311.1 hypothetical protein [Porticoccus sp. W117]
MWTAALKAYDSPVVEAGSDAREQIKHSAAIDPPLQKLPKVAVLLLLQSFSYLTPLLFAELRGDTSKLTLYRQAR